MDEFDALEGNCRGLRLQLGAGPLDRASLPERPSPRRFTGMIEQSDCEILALDVAAANLRIPVPEIVFVAQAALQDNLGRELANARQLHLTIVAATFSKALDFGFYRKSAYLGESCNYNLSDLDAVIECDIGIISHYRNIADSISDSFELSPIFNRFTIRTIS
ncbi:MAG: hypothetical protein ABI277_02210 [Burkholderiaceae bacterium]